MIDVLANFLVVCGRAWLRRIVPEPIAQLVVERGEVFHYVRGLDVAGRLERGLQSATTAEFAELRTRTSIRDRRRVVSQVLFRNAPRDCDTILITGVRQAAALGRRKT